MPSLTDDRFWELLTRKLSGEATDNELKELDLLLSNPDLEILSETISTLWHQHQSIDNSKSFEGFNVLVSKIQEKGIIFDLSSQGGSTSSLQEKRTSRLFPVKWWAGISSIAAIISAIVFITINNNNNNNISKDHPVSLTSQVTTRPGSRTQLRLPDGTSVWLNASSDLTYDKDFGKNLREVNLSGEAFFDVTKDSAHPFVIHTREINIKVLGTQFNVKAYPEDQYTETSLIQGRVEVIIKSRPNEKHFLKPNEKMLVRNDLPEELPAKKQKEVLPLISTEALTYDSVDNSFIETSWIDNHLIFHQNETFAEIAPKLERWYGVHIIFENQKIATEYRPFASFTNATITQVLDELKLAYKFNYKINENEITIT